MSRFDYVAYDESATKKQAKLKLAASKIESALEHLEELRQGFWGILEKELPETQWRDYAMEKLNDATGEDIEDALLHLEEAYMACGKAIRDEQIERNGSAPLQEGRNDG